MSDKSIEIPDMESPRFLVRVDTSTAVGTDESGKSIKALKLHMWVMRQLSVTEREGIQLPPVWMDATTAIALIRGLQSKLDAEFPAEVAQDRMANTTRQ